MKRSREILLGCIFCFCIVSRLSAQGGTIGVTGIYARTNDKDGDQRFYQGGTFLSYTQGIVTASGQFLTGRHNSVTRHDINGALSFTISERKDVATSIFFGVKGRIFDGSVTRAEFGPSAGITFFSYVGMSVSVAYARTYGDGYKTDFVIPSLYITEQLFGEESSLWLTTGYRGELVIGRPLFHGAFMNLFYVL